MNTSKQHLNLPSFITVEPFVDAVEAAAFLSVRPRFLLDMARTGEIPGYPLGNGPRRVWRFRLAELAASIVAKRTYLSDVVYANDDPSYASKPTASGRSK